MQTGNLSKLVALILAVSLALLTDAAFCAEVFGHKEFFDNLKKGKTIRLTYDFYLTGKKIGFLTSDFDKYPDNNPDQKEFQATSKLNLDFSPVGANKTVAATGRTYLNSSGRMLEYALNSTADGQESRIDAKIFDDSVKESMSTGTAYYKKEIKMPGKTFYILDNNMVEHWFLLFLMLNVKAEKNFEIEAFVPQSMLNMTLTLNYLGKESVSIQSREYEGLIYYVNEIGEIMSVTQNGLLARIEDPAQKLVISLSKLEISEKAGGRK